MANFWNRYSHLRDRKLTTNAPNRSVIRLKDGSTYITENGVTRKVDDKGKEISLSSISRRTPTIGYKQRNPPKVKVHQEDDGDFFDRGSYYDFHNSRHSLLRKKKEEKKKTNKFEFSNQLWKNYSYNNWTFNEDDDDELLCKDPINYITPTAFDIKKAVPAYEKEKIQIVKDLARFFYFQMIDDKDYISDKWKDPSSRTLYILKKIKILEDLKGNYVPGFTPFEKAKSVYYRILDDESKNQKDKRMGGANSFEFDRDVFEDQNLREHLNHHTFTKHHQFDILNKISLVKHFGKEFVISADVGEMRVANSVSKKSIRLKEYEDIFYVDLYQKVLPNFKTKFVTKDLNVLVPVEVERKKQKVIVLVDESGSMQQTDKQKWVTSIMAERFRHVIKGDAEIYFSYFVHRPYELKFIHIKDEKDVEKFWRYWYNSEPCGGGTDIGRIVDAVRGEIQSGKFFNLKDDLSVETPEILILNDGQDNANTKNFGYKVNAISLIQFSDQLKRLCLNSGGRQIRVKNEHELVSYSLNENKEEVENPVVA
jgi:hypothetical protein